MPSWHSWLPWVELTALCCRSWILPFSGCPPFLGLLVVRSSVRRWPDTKKTDRRRQNKVGDSILLYKADNIHRQDEINDWRNRRRAGEQDLHIYITIWIIFRSLTAVIQVQVFWVPWVRTTTFGHFGHLNLQCSDSSSSKECLSAVCPTSALTFSNLPFEL